METRIIGNKSIFAIGYRFEDSHETELSVYINDSNILAFERNGLGLTTKWDLDELTAWLSEFVDNLTDDPYPVDVPGVYAAIKDINARDYDSADSIEFDAYYDSLYKWNLRHRWHPASSGAILADVYFQLVGDYVEISWNNQNCEPDVIFQHVLGGASIEKEVFLTVVDNFLKDYAMHWFN